MEMASSTMILLLRSQADYRDFFKFPLVSVLITVISLSVTDVTNKNRDVVLTAAVSESNSKMVSYQTNRKPPASVYRFTFSLLPVEDIRN